jgi:hypothetical protein
LLNYRGREFKGSKFNNNFIDNAEIKNENNNFESFGKRNLYSIDTHNFKKFNNRFSNVKFNNGK